jgi:hypothetical protein
MYCIVHLVNGEDNIIPIYDNLDSEITARLLPLREGNLFSISNEEIVPQQMNGIKRNSLNASALSIQSVLFYLFPPIYAYLINFLIIKLLAFAGVYLLFSGYMLKDIENQNKIISGLLAFTFAIHPAYTIYGLAVLGLPLLIYCVLNILNGKNIYLNYLFVIVYPFYSSLVLGGFVVVGVMFVCGLWYYFRNEKRLGTNIVSISVMLGLLYIVSELNLFNQFLFDGSFVSHRTAWDPSFDQMAQTPEPLSFAGALHRVNNFFWYGEINAKIYPLVIFSFFIFMLVVRFRKIISDRYIISLFVLLVVIAFIYGFYFANVGPFIWMKEKSQLFKTFRVDRVFFFWAVYWYVFFALLIKSAFASKTRSMVIVTYLFVFLNLIYVFDNNRELKANIVISIKQKEREIISYKKFFAEDLFNKIKADIEEPLSSFRVVSVGLTPAVSLYNGFYSLDAYSNNYPLEHKYNFRRIIAPELEKSEKWKTSIDKWGCELFVFSSEIEYRPEFIPNKSSIEDLQLNTAALYEMGGRYIISSVEIKNFTQLNLRFVKQYTDKNTPLKVSLYEVLPYLAR